MRKYHPDYLGHNEYITDITGRPYQYFHYSAFGESLIEKNTNYGQFSSPYRFNAKELDGETGNYYYGARYYNPVWGIWLGVDPLAHKYPSMSPFVFTGNNPIMFIDPNGMEIDWGANFFGAVKAFVASRFTEQGRIKWMEMKYDSQAKYAFYYSDKMGIGKDAQGNNRVVEGMEYPTGQSKDGKINISVVTFEGTHKAKKHASDMFQQNNFEDLSYDQKNAGLNDALANGGVEATSWNNPNESININFNQVNLLFDFDITAPRPIDNERGIEFRNRIFVREGTHGLIRSGKWSKTVSQTGGLNSETIPRRYEHITIQQQKRRR